MAHAVLDVKGVKFEVSAEPGSHGWDVLAVPDHTIDEHEALKARVEAIAKKHGMYSLSRSWVRNSISSPQQALSTFESFTAALGRLM